MLGVKRLGVLVGGLQPCCVAPETCIDSTLHAPSPRVKSQGPNYQLGPSKAHCSDTSGILTRDVEPAVVVRCALIFIESIECIECSRGRLVAVGPDDR